MVKSLLGARQRPFSDQQPKALQPVAHLKPTLCDQLHLEHLFALNAPNHNGLNG
jgi:hypothetical protein